MRHEGEGSRKKVLVFHSFVLFAPSISSDLHQATQMVRDTINILQKAPAEWGINESKDEHLGEMVEKSK